jgi:hypothetical protein
MQETQGNRLYELCPTPFINATRALLETSRHAREIIHRVAALHVEVVRKLCLAVPLLKFHPALDLAQIIPIRDTMRISKSSIGLYAVLSVKGSDLQQNYVSTHLRSTKAVVLRTIIDAGQ